MRIYREAVGRVDLSAEQVGQRRSLAAIRHMGDLDAGHGDEQCAGHVAGRADAA
jgi:hypothetical protein